MSDVYQAPTADLVEDRPIPGYGSVEQAISGNYEFKLGDVLGEAWAKTSGSKWRFMLGAFIYLCIYMLVGGVIPAVVALVVGEGIVGSSVSLAVSIICVFVTMPMWGGILMMGIKRSVDEPFGGAEPLNYFHKILPIAGMLALMYLLLIVGFLLFVIPGIYLVIAYCMALPLMVEKNLGPWQALEASRKAVTKKWFSFFAFFIVCGFLALLASLPLLIGLIWVYPWLTIAYGIIYRNMFGYGQTA